jgi:hypothetical protein
MSVSHWLRARRQCTARISDRRVKPRLECLEGRTLLSVTVTDVNSGATFTTIQAAVNAATAGDVLQVSAGTADEGVNINKTLTLEGAQAGVDARTRSAAETIVEGTNNNGVTPFNVTANDVVIDGFTVQGASNANQFGAGIRLAPGTSGARVINDIIQNNIVGHFLENASSSNMAVVSHNLFRDNTLPGPASGTDIYADQSTAGPGGVQNVLIDSNTFTNTAFVESSFALGIANNGTTAFTGIAFMNNVVNNSGRGVYFFGTTGATITGNSITGTTRYAIGIFGNTGTPANTNFTISGNTLGASGSGAAAILVSDASTTPGSAYSGTLTLTGNQIALSGGAVAVNNQSTTPIDGTGDTLVLSATYFQLNQHTTADASGTHTTYTMNIDGTTEALPDDAFSSVVVNGVNHPGNTAVLYTNDTYTGTDGQTHETKEVLDFGQNGGRLIRFDSAGNPSTFVQLNNFATTYGFAGPADDGQLLATPGTTNTYVSAGSFAYMKSDDGQFHFIGGAGSVYGYSAGPNDTAFHYDGSGPSALVIQGMAYSFMTGTDNGASFFNAAVGFTHTTGIAQHAGQATAFFYDSPLHDVFIGTPSASYMYSINPDNSTAAFAQAHGFARVSAFSTDGNDVATNYDPNHIHVEGFNMT